MASQLEPSLSSAKMQTFTVTGMTCGGCVASLKAMLAAYAEKVEVTLNPPQAILTNCRVDLDALNKTLADTGDFQLSRL